jgi:hypothetical protein
MVWMLSKGAMCKQRFGAVLGAKVWCSVRVLCGAKQTSKCLVWWEGGFLRLNFNFS